MASFDWVAFLDQHRIDYQTVGRDQVETHCPYCGNADHSHHLAISLQGRGWKCWLQPQQHRGRSNAKLIRALLGCSWPEAFVLAGEDRRGPSLGEGEFIAKAKALLNGNPSSQTNIELAYPKEFRPLIPEGSGRYFVEYMEKRGYDEHDLSKLHKRYDLRCAIQGVFKYRVIFPIFIDRKLVTWTGRSISQDVNLRYQTLSANPDKAAQYGLPQAAMSIEKTLWNYDALREGGEELYICEGPFDALRLDYVGAKFDIRATCVFKKQVSEHQVSLLDAVISGFNRCVLLFDTGEHADTIRTRSQLAHLRLQTRQLPSGFKDPGEMDYQTAARFLNI